MKKVLFALLTLLVLAGLVSCDPKVDKKLWGDYAVTFISNDKIVDTQYVFYGEKAVTPELSIDGKMFAGWYIKENQEDEELFDFDTPITKNTILYAKWVSAHYVAFTATEGTVTIGMKKDSLAPVVNLQYSIDGEHWEPFTIGTTTITIAKDDISKPKTVYFQASSKNDKFGGLFLDGSDYVPHTNFFTTSSTDSGKVSVSGNIMSLLDKTGETKNFSTSPGKNDYAFLGLFAGCEHIEDAGSLVLPASILAECCYVKMFYFCMGLKKAPALPATTLNNACYMCMFFYCISLKKAPELPATTLANYCYQDMFSCCISLKTAPELPATKLADYCYDSMFNSCILLTEAPKLPATELGKNCYSHMFNSCSITKTPELPATELKDCCYDSMFQKCELLTEVSDLPATELADFCYACMFSGCKLLTKAQELLPAQELKSDCYKQMFQDCISLTETPELPATTLAAYCYQDMFNGCTSLTSAPELPATALETGCYIRMFKGCSSLNISTTSGTKFFSCPSVSTPDSYAENMFTNTAGQAQDVVFTPESGTDYYWTAE